MPVYTFRCPDGHEQDHLVRYEDRPGSLPCACGYRAVLVVALPGRGVVMQGTDGGKGQARRSMSGFREASPGVFVKGTGAGLDIVDWRCGQCRRTGFEVGDAVMPAVLPVCCGRAVERFDPERSNPDWFPVGGYYDRGANRYFGSRAERAAWATANGMVEIDGVNDDTDRAIRQEAEREAEIDAFWHHELRERDADPEMQRLKREGRLPQMGDDWIRELVNYKG